MLERLKIVLDALGYESAKGPRDKSGLIHAIQLFALMQGDVEMEAACDAEIENIRQEVVRRQSRKS
jgi:hypothetical protein